MTSKVTENSKGFSIIKPMFLMIGFMFQIQFATQILTSNVAKVVVYSFNIMLALAIMQIQIFEFNKLDLGELVQLVLVNLFVIL